MHEVAPVLRSLRRRITFPASGKGSGLPLRLLRGIPFSGAEMLEFRFEVVGHVIIEAEHPGFIIWRGEFGCDAVEPASAPAEQASARGMGWRRAKVWFSDVDGGFHKCHVFQQAAQAAWYLYLLPFRRGHAWPVPRAMR